MLAKLCIQFSLFLIEQPKLISWYINWKSCVLWENFTFCSFVAYYRHKPQKHNVHHNGVNNAEWFLSDNMLLFHLKNLTFQSILTQDGINKWPVKSDIFAESTISKHFCLITINSVTFAEKDPVMASVGGLTLGVPAFPLTRGALTRGRAGPDPTLTTAMWLFVQPTCTELNTETDWREMRAGIREQVSLKMILRYTCNNVYWVG